MNGWRLTRRGEIVVASALLALILLALGIAGWIESGFA